jgi:hypothetical protein
MGIKGCGAPEVRHYFLPECRASGAQTAFDLVSQPFRAGLTFGFRPYGPGSICDLLRVLKRGLSPDLVQAFMARLKRLGRFPWIYVR